MACKEHHRISPCAGSPEGCWILAGGNTPGYHDPLITRPGGAQENRKVRQGMQSESRYARKVRQGIIPKSTVDLGCAHNRRLHFALRQSSVAFRIYYFSAAWTLVLGIFLCVLCVLLRLKTLVIKRAHSKSPLLKPTKGGRGVPQNQALPMPLNRPLATINSINSITYENMQPSTFNLQHIEKPPFFMQSISLKKSGANHVANQP
jgi:hypothetical protein